MFWIMMVAMSVLSFLKSTLYSRTGYDVLSLFIDRHDGFLIDLVFGWLPCMSLFIWVLWL